MRAPSMIPAALRARYEKVLGVEVLQLPPFGNVDARRHTDSVVGHVISTRGIRRFPPPCAYEPPVTPLGKTPVTVLAAATR